MLTRSFIILFFYNSIHIDIAISIWAEKDINDLFSSPQFNRFNYTWRRDFNPFIGITEVWTNGHELAAIKEGVFLSYKIAWGQKILGCCNKRISRFWHKQILFNIH